MAIKIISEDSKLAYIDASNSMQILIKRFDSTRAELAKVSADLATALRTGKINPAKFQEVLEITEQYKHAVKVIKNSLASTASKNSEVDPVSASFSDPNFEKLIFGIKPKGKLFLFKNKSWDISGPFSDDEAKLILLERYKKQRSGAELLTYRRDNENVVYNRTVIPENVNTKFGDETNPSARIAEECII